MNQLGIDGIPDVPASASTGHSHLATTARRAHHKDPTTAHAAAATQKIACVLSTFVVRCLLLVGATDAALARLNSSA